MVGLQSGLSFSSQAYLLAPNHGQRLISLQYQSNYIVLNRGDAERERLNHQFWFYKNYSGLLLSRNYRPTSLRSPFCNRTSERLE
ncbi:hypothetical protein WG66_001802 [Moniliophthora roreri]|nr:hypothetical protein WG66_001802 [Moniliophthora roreri]